MAELASVVPGPWKRRCTAKSKRSGERCKRWAIKGGDVCPIHGGTARHVRERAEQRMEDRLRAFGRRSMEAAESALDAVEEIASDTDASPQARIAAFRAATSGVQMAKDTVAESDEMPADEIELTQEIMRLMGADEAAIADVGKPGLKRTRDLDAEILANYEKVALAQLLGECQRVGMTPTDLVAELEELPTPIEEPFPQEPARALWEKLHGEKLPPGPFENVAENERRRLAFRELWARMEAEDIDPSKLLADIDDGSGDGGP